MNVRQSHAWLPLAIPILLAGCGGSSPPPAPAVPPAAPTPAASAAVETQPPALPIADRANLTKQHERLQVAVKGLPDYAPAYETIGQEWIAAVRALVDSGEIKVGQSRSAIYQLLGTPSHAWPSDANGQSVHRWSWQTSRHVNPAFDITFEGDTVVSFRFAKV